METEKDFIVFYSWQSDLPEKTNRKAIRNALRVASSRVEEDFDGKVLNDEATRDESGSPNIPFAIMKKIAACDLFLCDITTINGGPGTVGRKTPNPNVLFELGYAVATIGWERITMLFNKAHGEFPSDLPFDIDRHRASPYFLSESDEKNKSNIAGLQTTLQSAVNSVIKKSPEKPSEISKKSPEEIRNSRDVEKLTWALSMIHLPSLDQMIIDLPHSIRSSVFHFWESFRGTVENPLFHLYDDAADRLIADVKEGWEGCLAHGEKYIAAPNSNVYIFSNGSHAPFSTRQDEAWENINEARALLKTSLDNLLRHVRNNYIDIDLDKLSANAWRSYIDFEREMLDDLEK